jgi:hypothetical protein
VDDRLIGKTFQQENSSIELDKLAAAPSFVQGLSSVSTVLATVRVSQPDYIPASLNLRTRISPTLFTATMSKQELVATLKDSAVEVVQPSEIIHPDTNP